MKRSVAKRVLFIDRHPAHRRLRAALTGSGYAVVSAAGLQEGLKILREGFRPHVAVVGDCGAGTPLEVVRALRGARRQLPIVLLALRTEELAEEPWLAWAEREQTATVERAIARLLEAPAPALRAVAEEASEPIFAAAPMRAIRELVQQVADTDVPVLITGESGVGKEVIARLLHTDSARRGAAFVKVNCAALPEQLLESELFGTMRGAFTGADEDRPGKFELAHGGTIFLDEIGEISSGTQAKLLQVLQDGCYYRLGGNREVRVDARVVASTNRRLEDAMAEGTFRTDLFYRLNVVRVEVPPLRERRDEIPLLARLFQRRYERQYGRNIGELPGWALEALRRYDWPGNVRELENLVRRMVVLQDVEGSVATLEPHRRGAASPFDVDSLIGPEGRIPPLKEVSRLAALEVEGELIRRALEQTNWNRRKAAELLDISYKALLYKIRDCGITAA